MTDRIEHATGDAPDAVADDVLDDLRRRLSEVRRVPLPRGVGWERGTDAQYLDELLPYWAAEYDWRAPEARILNQPWVRAVVDGVGVRAIHRRVDDPNASTVVLLHGWPDSVLRFERVLPLLDDVNVVVPALPGYPFAEPLHETGMSSSRMAQLVAGLLRELGCDRYVVSGGDIGSRVAESLGVEFPERVGALHLTDVPSARERPDDDDLSGPERQYLQQARSWQRSEGAYAHEQSTKPHTLAVGLGDSPAGLAAWIVEKLRDWSDCHGEVESAFPRDDLLTWVTAYWVTGTIGTSFSPYYEPRDSVGRVAPPAVIQQFPRELVVAPPEFAQRFFDVREWIEEPDGGHFGAWERPDRYVQGVRAAIGVAAAG